MKIIKARPRWYETYDNMPGMEILVDAIPPNESLRYEERNGLYFAELDGYVSFYYYQKPGGGFGGCEFKLVMKDGSEKLLRGPWSSNPAAMNSAGFMPSADVAFTADPKSYEQGYTFYAGHITAELFKEACKVAGVYCVENDGAFYPSLLPCGVVKLWTPYGTKRTVARWMLPRGSRVELDLSAEQSAVVHA